MLYIFKGVVFDTSLDMSIINVFSWSLDGEMLFVLGLKNEVVMYDRDIFEKLFFLKGDYVKFICFLFWLFNGKYLVILSLDK